MTNTTKPQLSIPQTLQAIYLDWINNYITIDRFAEHNALTHGEALELLSLCHSVHERLVEEYKEANQ